MAFLINTLIKRATISANVVASDILLKVVVSAEATSILALMLVVVQTISHYFGSDC